MKALLLAAGYGTRLRPITDRVPKCLVPIAGTPLLEFWLQGLERVGVDEVVINTHHLDGQVRRFLTDRSGTRVRVMHEPVLLGTARTLLAAEELLVSDDFFVIYADNLTTFDLRRLRSFHGTHSEPASLTMFHAHDPSQCGVVDVDVSGLLTGLEEKPKRPKSNLCNAGIYLMRPAVFEYCRNLTGKDLATALVPRITGHAYCLTINEFFLDIGTPGNLRKAQRVFPKLKKTPTLPTRVVLVDRDGVINRRVPNGYVRSAAGFTFLEGAVDALRILHENGFVTLIVSNQACIGKNLLSHEEFLALNQYWCSQVRCCGGLISGVYFCPHVPEDVCLCRKPRTGLLEAAQADWGFDASQTFLIGDSAEDIEAGQHFGCRTVLVGARNGRPTRPDFAARSLREASDIVLEHS